MRAQLLLLLVLVPALALGALASTCVVVEEGPADIPYGEESNTQAMEEEEEGEVMRESDL